MRWMAAMAVLVAAMAVRGGEEKIRGTLEKTTKPGACAQITDALGDVYYVNKTDEAEKAVAAFVGKNQKVVIAGTVETKEGDTALYFSLKTAAAYEAKLPPAPPPPPPPAPPVAEKKDEPKKEEVKKEEPKAEEKEKK